MTKAGLNRKYSGERIRFMGFAAVLEGREFFVMLIILSKFLTERNCSENSKLNILQDKPLLEREAKRKINRNESVSISSMKMLP